MKSYPWNSVATDDIGEDGFPVYDRAYDADDLREVYRTFLTNGVVLANDGGAFKVSPGTGMSVVVNPGKCFIQGTVGWEKEERKMILQASSDLDRIDTVVLRWDVSLEKRDIDLYVKTGVASNAPKRPELTRTSTVYELGIADIFVAKETGSVVSQRITDTRMEKARCGMAALLIDFDTTSFHDQLQAQTQEAVDLARRMIDETEIGHLQAQIDENEAKMSKAIDSIGSELDKRVMRSGDTMTGELKLQKPLGAPYGGTGQTSLQATRSAMGLGNTLDALPPANGGTGIKAANIGALRKALLIPQIFRKNDYTTVYGDGGTVDIPIYFTENFASAPAVFVQVSGINASNANKFHTVVHGTTNSMTNLIITCTGGNAGTKYNVYYYILAIAPY